MTATPATARAGGITIPTQSVGIHADTAALKGSRVELATCSKGRPTRAAPVIDIDVR